MDLSPKLLTDVQFREQWRGYNPEEVDEFLERVAAGVEELQQRLVDALERASNAERRLLERSDDDEIRRTLVLAQRTAVASMEEARVEADRLVSETEARCRQLVAEAEAQAARLDADIATRRRMELGDLAEQRAALQLDIDTLREFVESERARFAGVLRGHIEWLESEYQMSEVPPVSDVAPVPSAPQAPVEMRAPAFLDAPVVEEEPVHEEPPEDDWQPVLAEPEPVASSVDELRQAREELADALRRAGVDPDDQDARDDAPPVLAKPSLYDDGAVGEGTGAYDALAEPPDASEVDEPQWREDAPEPAAEHVDDDPFLAELRRAVIDTEPLGPRDHDDAPRPITLEDDAGSGGFLRRRRRG
jgi:cell division initiation protein